MGHGNEDGSMGLKSGIGSDEARVLGGERKLDDGVFELDRGNVDGVSDGGRKDWGGGGGGEAMKAVIDSLDSEGRKLVESLDWVMKAAELLVNDGGCSGGVEIAAAAESLGLQFKDGLANTRLGVKDIREMSSRQGGYCSLVEDSGLNQKAVGSSFSLRGAEVSYDSIIQDFFSQPHYKIPITEERGFSGKKDTNDEQIKDINKGGVSENNGVGLVVDLNTYISINGKNGHEKGSTSEGILVKGKPADLGNPISSGNHEILAGEHKENRETPKDGGKNKPKQTTSKSVFSASDLVWGKIRSHPWWPGQIFDPSYASENAMNYFNKSGLLIAYFGDGTFAWNETSKLKPFGAHFLQLEKQNNSEAFNQAVDCALDEVARRVEFGLSCPCLSEGLNANLKSQIIRNSGVCTESRKRNSSDEYSSATSFIPVKLVEYIKGLAKTSCGVDDKHEHVIAQAQLLSLYRWKGYPQLAVFKMLDGYSGKGTDILYTRKKRRQSEEMDDFVPNFLVAEQHDSSPECRNGHGDKISFRKRKKSISNFMARTKNGDSTSTLKYVYASTQKATVKNESKKRPDMANKSKGKKDVIPINWSSSSSGEMLTQMCLVASNPLEGSDFDNSMISSFSEFRNSVCSNHPGSSKRKLSPEEETDDKFGKKLVNAEITVLSGEERVKDSYRSDTIIEGKPDDQLLSDDQETDGGKSSGKKLAYTDIKMLPSDEYLKDSDWSDMIIEGKPDDRLLSDMIIEGKPDDRLLSDMIIEGKPDDQLLCDMIIEGKPDDHLPSDMIIEGKPDQLLSDMIIKGKPDDQLQSDNQKTDGGNIGVDQIDENRTEKSSENRKEESSENRKEESSENRKEESSPTALILNFTDLGSVPSPTNLNKIFSVYGPLIESETEIMKKRSARVVFKYHSDAETAFSSAGKYSTLGPSLLSYRLKYLHSTKKSSTPKRRRKASGQGDIPT